MCKSLHLVKDNTIASVILLQVRRISHMRPRCVFALTTLVALCTVLVETGAAQGTAPTRAYPPPGKMVDVGGWRLHLNCTGSSKRNGPTVVLEAGAGDFSVDWGLVQPEVARFARVCSYDRAGAGWSELGPRPRTWRQIAYELHTALQKAGEKGRYVVVGQSLGGLLIRTFASQYPKEVAGMVLVDSTHEDTVLMMNGKFQRMRELSQGRTIPPIRTTISAAEKDLSAEEKEQTADILKRAPKIGSPYNLLPADLQAARLWVLTQQRHYTADGDPYWGEEFAELYAARQKEEQQLGDRPLVVLLTNPGPPGGKPPSGFSADEWQRVNEEKRQQKVEFTKLSSNSKLIVTEKSEHHIHLAEPAVVTRAIQMVVDAAQRHTKLAP